MVHARVTHTVLNCDIFKTLLRSARLGRVEGSASDRSAAHDLCHRFSSAQHTRHIDRKLFKLREMRGAGLVTVKYLGTEENTADLFTKILDRQLSDMSRDDLYPRLTDAWGAGGWVGVRSGREKHLPGKTPQTAPPSQDLNVVNAATKIDPRAMAEPGCVDEGVDAAGEQGEARRRGAPLAGTANSSPVETPSGSPATSCGRV